MEDAKDRLRPDPPPRGTMYDTAGRLGTSFGEKSPPSRTLGFGLFTQARVNSDLLLLPPSPSRVCL